MTDGDIRKSEKIKYFTPVLKPSAVQLQEKLVETSYKNVMHIDSEYTLCIAESTRDKIKSKSVTNLKSGKLCPILVCSKIRRPDTLIDKTAPVSQITAQNYPQHIMNEMKESKTEQHLAPIIYIVEPQDMDEYRQYLHDQHECGYIAVLPMNNYAIGRSRSMALLLARYFGFALYVIFLCLFL